MADSLYIANLEKESGSYGYRQHRGDHRHPGAGSGPALFDSLSAGQRCSLRQEVRA